MVVGVAEARGTVGAQRGVERLVLDEPLQRPRGQRDERGFVERAALGSGWSDISRALLTQIHADVRGWRARRARVVFSYNFSL